MSTEEFQDFSYATHWEKLSGEIEQVLRRWLWIKHEALTKEQCYIELKQKLHFRKEPYLLSLQLPDIPNVQILDATSPTPITESTALERTASIESSVSSLLSQDQAQEEQFECLPHTEDVKESTEMSSHAVHSNPNFSTDLFFKASEQFDDTLPNLQRWFGINRFVLLQPGSQSGRILDSQEASTVLSAAAVALSEFPRAIPIFIPIQDSYRDAYKGVAVVDNRTVFFDVDSSHLTQHPQHLKSVIGQLQVFSKQLMGYSSRGAQFCDDIANGIDSEIDDYEIDVSACVTFALSGLNRGSEDAPEDEEFEHWDDGCVWQPWAAQKDPVASLELDLIWDNVELSSEDATVSLSVRNSRIWKIHCLQQCRSNFHSWSIFSKKSSFARKHLVFPTEYNENTRSCFARLLTLLEGVHLADAAHYIGELDSEEWWSNLEMRLPSVPPGSLLEDSIHDLFGDDYNGKNLHSMSQHVVYEDPIITGNNITEIKKGDDRFILNQLSPFNSLTARLALHCVVYRNARAVALLWVHFVQTIRVHFWEKLQMIPLNPTSVIDPETDKESESPDLNNCLIHQKLQMLNVCIHRLKKKRVTRTPDPANDQSHRADISEAKGIERVLSGAFLENSPEVPVYVPITQALPIHTSDTLAEEASVLSTLLDSSEDRERASKEQAKVLISDMAAFKAANPQSQLCDFVKWHSPKDWVLQENGEGYLSQRMSHEKDNKWKKFWDEVDPCPAVEQLPLFDPALAGERALHCLETIEPSKLFWQLFQLALVGCFGLLERSPTSRRNQVKLKLQECHQKLKQDLLNLENQLDSAVDLLESFKVAEMSVVFGESLSKHLPNSELTINLLLDELSFQNDTEKQEYVDPEVELFSVINGVNIPTEDRESILKFLLKAEQENQQQSEEEAQINKPIEVKSQATVISGAPLQNEWIITCGKKSEKNQSLKHKLYFKDASHEVRLGTVLISEL